MFAFGGVLRRPLWEFSFGSILQLPLREFSFDGILCQPLREFFFGSILQLPLWEFSFDGILRLQFLIVSLVFPAFECNRRNLPDCACYVSRTGFAKLRLAAVSV